MDASGMKRTIKIGNWQEEKALENIMNGKVYDPKIKTSTALTNLRVIKHSAEVDAKDYQSVVRGTYTVPQQHVEYKTSLVGKKKGPRERLREQMMKDTVESEFKMKEAEAEKERNSRQMESTSQASYSKEFTQTLRDRRSGILTGQRRDPYYLVPSPITYYLHTLLSGHEISFPVTTIGSLNKPWARGDSVSAGSAISLPLSVTSSHFRQIFTMESYANLELLKTQGPLPRSRNIESYFNFEKMSSQHAQQPRPQVSMAPRSDSSHNNSWN
jgi:hypothetical protein